MSLRKTLSLIQYISLTVAVVSLLIVLFTVGDTDFGAEAPPPPVTLAFAVLCGVGAMVGALIQWIGLPLPDKEEESKGKARASSAKRPESKPPSESDEA